MSFIQFFSFALLFIGGVVAWGLCSSEWQTNVKFGYSTKAYIKVVTLLPIPLAILGAMGVFG